MCDHKDLFSRRCYISSASSCADAHSSSDPPPSLLPSPSISVPPTPSSCFSFSSPSMCFFACPSSSSSTAPYSSSSRCTVADPCNRAAPNALPNCPPCACTFAPCSSNNRTMP
ncbi:hypothetical protein FIBSPDRAFT_36279 [Athelia psychrophila]|uniref:Uncharacterized protein n=1 Tax=Athelia psychrophila TaxID=1759441 RepID=A0A166FTN0_9AGAM|nr:hypothetical protein FIBSPDRAFT_36279 [Fibularhizoctonia sp. CBS 109695]